ncbi:hypothetical protein J530_4047, partial [Acinetobacter baumannii 15827]
MLTQPLFVLHVYHRATCPRCELMKFASIPLLDYRF